MMKHGIWVLVLAVTLSACGGKEKRVTEHMDKARQFLAQGSLDKAKVELKNVLQIDAKAAEPYYLFGQIEEREKNLQRAFGYYLKAVELDPTNSGARAKLGTFYVLAADLENATKQADAILAQSAQDPDGQALKASIQARSGDVTGAAVKAQAVVAAHPKHVDARSLLAALKTKQGEREQAIAVLSEGVAQVPDSRDLRLALISLLSAQGQVPEAAKQYEALIQIDPNSIDHRVGLARLQAEQGDLDRAEATLRAAIAANPDDERRYLFLADFLAARRDAARAQTALKEFIAKRPETHALRFALARVYLGQGDFTSAQTVYQDVIALDALGPSGLRARAELADYYLGAGNNARAETLVAEVLKTNPRDNRALTLRARMALGRGDAVNAIADLRAVMKDQPDSVEVITELVRAHLANDEAALAKDTLAQALGRYPDSTLLRTLSAEVKTATNDLSGADSDLRAVLDRQPTDARALAARAALEMRRGDATAAERTLLRIKEASATDPTAYHRLGAFYLSQKRFRDAEQAFESALALVPGAIEPLTGLVNLYVARGNPQLGVTRLKQVVTDTPENYLAWALLGHAHAAAREDAAAESAFRTAVQKSPTSVGTHMELTRFLAARGDPQAAQKAAQSGLQFVPDHAPLSALLAELHRAGGQVSEAMQVYERMLAVDSQNAAAANNLAALLLDHRTDRASFERALKLTERFETSLNPAYLDSLGWSHYRLGNYERAVDLLGRASARAPQSVLISFHLGLALHGKGEIASAKTHLRKAVDSKMAIPGIEQAKQILAAG